MWPLTIVLLQSLHSRDATAECPDVLPGDLPLSPVS
jgi:hypothetical protein